MLEQKIKPMLAQVSGPFDSPNYIFEIKWDGTRCIAFIDKGAVRLQNRRLLDITYRYPELQNLAQELSANSAILDGELVVLEHGKPNFRRLQEREQISAENKIEIRASLVAATYVVFDLLYLNGRDFTRKPLIERKEKLKQIIKQGGVHLVTADYIDKEGKIYFSEAVKQGFEGIVAKEKNSPYLAGERARHWLKIKKKNTQDALICGYTRGFGQRGTGFGSLILGAFDQKAELVYIGRVGTGFSDEEIQKLFQILRKLEVKESPFKKIPEIHRQYCWVEPRAICEVEFMEWSPGGKMRAPSYKGLKEDKDIKDCIIERGVL